MNKKSDLIDISIDLNMDDFNSIDEEARKLGMSQEELISKIVHQYANGEVRVGI